MRRKHHRRYQGRFTRLASLARSLTAPAAAGLLLASLFTAGSQSIAQTMTAPDITSEGPFLVDEGETAVATLTADDSDTTAGDLIWSKTGGADSSKFSLTSAGVLTFSSVKDYEAPDAADTDRTYEVTVQVSDGSETDSADLVVTLKNVVELTALSGPATVDYEENRAVRVATYSASSEADQDGLTWSLSGEDASSFSIDEPEGVLRFDLAVVSPNLFSPQPDYDSPADADSDGTYEVTVEVGDGVTSHSLAVEVTIKDQGEAGTLTLSTTRPQFGVALMTTLTDPDGLTGTVTYQWERSVGRSAWMDIVGETASSFTPTIAETGHFLRVTATYIDGHGGGKTVTARTSEVVTADLLSGLTVSTTDSAANSGHALRPSFDAGILHYSIGCAASGETMTLTPTAGSGVRLSIDGTQVSSGESHTAAVDADGEVRVTLAGASGAATTYFVRCLSGVLLDMTATTATGATGVIEDLIMFGAGRNTRERSVAIVDATGAVRFHLKNAEWRGGYFRAAWVDSEGGYRYFYNKQGAGQHWQILDQNLELIDDVGTVAPLMSTNNHNAWILENGDYVLSSYERVDRDLSELTFGTFGTSVRMRDSAIQIRTPDGTSLFDWNSYDAIPLEDCKPGFPPMMNDYAHLNTLQMVDGHIVASFRGCNSVLRIDPDDASSHKVVWRLGLTNLSDEQWDALGKGPAPLEIIGDAEGQFCGQHGSALLPNGHLILFDNGVLCMHDPWLNTQLLPRPGGQYSCAVEYALDVANGEAVFVRDHSLGGRRSAVGFKHGHVEYLPNGDWLVGWGGWEPTTGPKPKKSVTQVDPNTGEEKFSIALLQADGSSDTFRPIPLPPAALADDPVPLTAEFPASDHTSLFHTGSGDAPQVIVVFNQPVVDFDETTPSLSVTGATVASVSAHVEAGEAANSYVVTLTPAGASDITVRLVADQPCADGGICTAGETLLSEVPASHVIRADTTPPTVSKIEVSSDPGTDRTYAAGDEIEVTVTFSETVEVTGTPQLRLKVETRNRTADYDSGTGTAALVFAYEVADGDEDTVGVSIEAGRIALNGGTIEDEADNAAVLEHEAVAPQAVHAAGHQRGAGRRAHRLDVELGELDPLVGEAVHVGRLYLCTAVETGLPPTHVVGDEYQNVGPRVGVFNRLCGKLARHTHDRQDKEGCEQRRIAAQVPGTLVATAFAHLAIGRGRKEPAERHEGRRRDGYGRRSYAARFLGRRVCIDPCGACSCRRPVPRHASSPPSPSPASSWDYRYSNCATPALPGLVDLEEKGKISRQRQERAFDARTAHDDGFVTAVGPEYGGVWSRGAWELGAVLYTRHAYRTEEVDNYQGEPDDRTHLAD